VKVLQAAVDACRTGRRCALVTVIGRAGSTPRGAAARMLVYADGTIAGTIGGGAFEHQAIHRALGAIASGRPARYSAHLTRDLGMCCGGAMEAWIEPLRPPDHLVIYGAGHVATATASLAVAADFAVTVVDDRDEWADPARFPDRVTVLEADPRRVLDRLPVGPRAYHLVVTHDHALDQDLVQSLLPRDLGWIGLIGSRAKVAAFFVRYRAAGIDPALFERLSAPVGLDLGAETPEEIAISILAELVRIRRRSDRPPLPLSDQPIAARGGDGRARPLAFTTPDDGLSS